MKTKLRASLFHLLISVLLVTCVFAMVILVCYPDPYYKVMGATRLLLILTLVDVGLGPLTTFVIYNPTKKWLKLELAFVGAVQLAALAYGVSVFYAARPAYMVYTDQHLTLVSAFEIPPALLPKLKEPDLPRTGPKLVGAQVPDDKAERKKFYDDMLINYHVDLPRLPQYFVPYESVKAEVKENLVSFDKLVANGKQPQQRQARKDMIDRAIAASGEPAEALAWIYLQTRDVGLTAVLRKRDASLVTILPIDPYEK